MTIAQRGETFFKLVEIMHQLRAPGGCPWDREQTLETLRRYVIEEAHEVVEAIDGGEPQALCEELGDLLLQVVFQAELCSEQNHFGIDDVIQAIVDKMVRRHPHVFGTLEVSGSNEVLKNWAKIKADEKAKLGKKVSRLDGVPVALSALVRAERIGEKAAQTGFDWPDAAAVREKITEELGEIDAAVAAGNAVEIEAEIGDLLFAISRYAAKLGLSAEDALRKATRRFSSRFGHMEQNIAATDTAFESLDAAAWDKLWSDAKHAEAHLEATAKAQ